MIAQNQFGSFIHPARAAVAARLPGARRRACGNANARAARIGPDQRRGAIACSVARDPRRASAFPVGPCGLPGGGGTRMRHASIRVADPTGARRRAIRSTAASRRRRGA